MNAEPTPPAFIEIIQQRLKACGITEAAIIDDTYDGLSLDAIERSLTGFISKLEDEDDLATEVIKFCPDLKRRQDFSVDEARLLWNARATWTPILEGPLRELYQDYIQRETRLSAIAAGLKKLGLKVHELGVDAEIPPTVPLVFLDYQLEPEKEKTAQAIAQATDLAMKGKMTAPVATRAAKIASELARRGQNRPFLVLISDWYDLDKAQDSFRKSTNYLAGTFAFLAKTTAAQEDSLFFHLRCWGVGNAALPAITNFFTTVTESIEEITKQFREALLAMDVQDYSFIQRLSLTADGEPLGEYFLQLFAESLGHRVRNHEAVKKARVSLDKVHFFTHLISTTQPSAAVARLYREAFTDRGSEPLECHPLESYEVSSPAQKKMLRVGQGDIFITPDKKVIYLLINAACDLQYSPLNPKRPADPHTLLYLLKGSLTEFSAPIAHATELRTEPFEIDNTPYRIFWHRTLVAAVPLGELEEWCKKTGCARIGRLREIYTASLQHDWASNVGRLGPPVAPPYFSAADFQMYIREGDVLRAVGPRVLGQVVLTQHWHAGDLIYSFTLTQDGVKSFKSGFLAAAEQLTKEAGSVPAGAPYSEAKIKARLNLAAEARAMPNNLEYLCQLMESEHLLGRSPGSVWKPKPSVRKSVHFFWHAHHDGKNIKDAKLPSETILLVDVLEPSPTMLAPIELPIVVAETLEPAATEAPIAATEVTSESVTHAKGL